MMESIKMYTLTEALALELRAYRCGLAQEAGVYQLGELTLVQLDALLNDRNRCDA